MAIKPGQKIQDPKQLKQFKEKDIARVGEDIYRRDLGAEQKAMKNIAKAPQSEQEWQEFRKNVYSPDRQTSGGETQPEDQQTTDLPDRTGEELSRVEAEQAQKFSERSKETLNVLKAQQKDARQRREELRQQIEDLKQKREKNVVEPLESLTEPFRMDYMREGRKEFDLKKKYNRYSELSQNLATYAEQAMGDIEALNRPGMTKSFYQGRRQQKLDEINTKISLTQTAMAGVKNDISLGRTFIDRGIEKIQQDRQDQISYLETVDNIITSEMEEIQQERGTAMQRERKSISERLKVIREEFNTIEEQKNKVREFLVGDNAKVAMDAGVKLNDDYDTMVSKVVDYYKQNPQAYYESQLSFNQKVELQNKGLNLGADGLPYDSTVQIPQGTIASRHNNPGNLMYAGQEGAEKGEPKAGGGYWAKFDTPEAGFMAIKNQIELDAGRGKTLGGFIRKYAPPSENDTENYIRQMEKGTGHDRNDPLSKVPTTSLAKNIAYVESGTTFEGGDQQDIAKDRFTDTQINKGAAKANMSISEFEQLSPDKANQYIYGDLSEEKDPIKTNYEQDIEAGKPLDEMIDSLEELGVDPFSSDYQDLTQKAIQNEIKSLVDDGANLDEAKAHLREAGISESFVNKLEEYMKGQGIKEAPGILSRTKNWFLGLFE